MMVVAKINVADSRVTIFQLLIFNTLAVAMFSASVYFTRATFRRAAGALVGGLSAVGSGAIIDQLYVSMGWWTLPHFDEAWHIVLMYSIIVLTYGAAAALIGWRIIRRYGVRGLICFVVFMAVYGTTRDYLGAAVSGMIEVGPGMVPIIADMALWAGAMLFVQLVMYLVAGPPKDDRLART